MATMRPLARPPIREAIIDVKSEPCSFDKVTQLRDRIAAQFPRSRPFRLASLALQLPDERRGAELDSTSGRQAGWRCESADGAEVVLARTDGFSIARLEGYTGWDAFFDRFLSMWGAYVACVAPTEVRRVGLRYINEVRLPVADGLDFDHFLTSVPRAPQGMSQGFVDFLVQMTLPGQGEGIRVAITQATDSAARTGAELPVILDIDVSCDRLLLVDETLPARLGDALRAMREVKNQAFFGLVTDKLVSTYL